MDYVLEFLNKTAGLLAFCVGVLIAWLNSKIRAELAELSLDIINRDAQIIREANDTFIKKPELIDDYPVSRREFYIHREEDKALHLTVDARLENLHQRMRSNESNVARIEIELASMQIRKADKHTNP